MQLLKLKKQNKKREKIDEGANDMIVSHLKKTTITRNVGLQNMKRRQIIIIALIYMTSAKLKFMELNGGFAGGFFKRQQTLKSIEMDEESLIANRDIVW